MERVAQDALQWLDQMYADLSKDPKYYGVYLEIAGDFERYMLWQIQLYQGDRLEAIKGALGHWLDADDRGKLETALWLIEALHATEHAPRIQRLLDEIRVLPSRWSPDWRELVEGVLGSLRRPEAG